MTMFENVVNTCKPYLGPASEQFIRRQCSLQMKLEAEQLATKHLAALAQCVEVGAVRFMDADKAKELSVKLARL